VANVDARVHNDRANGRGSLGQLCSPVRWRQTLETLDGLGATVLVEVGPGGVLSGLARRAAPDLQALSVAARRSRRADGCRRHPGVWRSETHVHHGEHLYMSERVVVSPAGGIFAPESPRRPGTGLLPARPSPRRSGTLDGGGW